VVQFLVGAGIFFLRHLVQTGYGSSYPGEKGPGREADHSPPSNAEFKNAWNFTFTPPYVFNAWCLVSKGYVFMVWYSFRHRCNFTLLYFTFIFNILHSIPFFRSPSSPTTFFKHLNICTFHTRGLASCNMVWGEIPYAILSFQIVTAF
jgi:hypothetical protein